MEVLGIVWSLMNCSCVDADAWNCGSCVDAWKAAIKMLKGNLEIGGHVSRYCVTPLENAFNQLGFSSVKQKAAARVIQGDIL